MSVCSWYCVILYFCSTYLCIFPVPAFSKWRHLVPLFSWHLFVGLILYVQLNSVFMSFFLSFYHFFLPSLPVEGKPLLSRPLVVQQHVWQMCVLSCALWCHFVLFSISTVVRISCCRVKKLKFSLIIVMVLLEWCLFISVKQVELLIYPLFPLFLDLFCSITWSKD